MSNTLPPPPPPPPLSQPSPPPPITIKVLADEVRGRAIPALGEAAFARLCMEFDRRVDPTSNDYVRYVRIVEILALEGPTDATVMQLGMVWLDGHGYGGWTIEELGQELERVRQDFKQREE